MTEKKFRAEDFEMDDIDNSSNFSRPSENDFEAKYQKELVNLEELKKKQAEERKDFYKYRASSFILQLVSTVDMFDLAMKNKASDNIKKWVSQFNPILDDFKLALEKENVVEIDVNIGDEFNEYQHYAIDLKETDQFRPGQIVEIKQRGFMIHERLLRPVTVIVAKEKG